MNTEILNELNKYSSYDDIYKFMDYLLINKFTKNILINDLGELSSYLSQDSLQYFIVTDILDFLTGFHGILKNGSKEFYFIQNIVN